MNETTSTREIAFATFLLSLALVLFELALTRVFSVILWASYAHLALGLAMLGITAGAALQQVWPTLVPAEGLRDRVAQWSLGVAASAAFAGWAAVAFPATRQSDAPPTVLMERSAIAWDLLDPVWFLALLTALVVPFTLVGIVFAGVFQRCKEDIGTIYAADLVGGAAGALAFLPLLAWVPAPDAVFVVAALAALAAVAIARGPRLRATAGGIAAGAMVLAGIASGAGGVLQVRYAAGYSEVNVRWTRWTPLTRIAVHEDERGTYMLLDNTSASEVILTEARRKEKSKELARSLVYRLHEAPARVAILAASAGPEVACAQAYGYTDIDAIDIASQIGDAVATRFPPSAFNPYTSGNTRRVWSDGRAAILHAREPYDIIQMVHANLHSAAGLLAQAWSPNLLQTVEAFDTYLDHLSDDGTISFAAGTGTRVFVRAASEALRRRGVGDPAAHLFFETGNNDLLLVKKRPWTAQESAKVQRLLQTYPGAKKVVLDPVRPDRGKWRELNQIGLMTDDRPFLESPADVWKSLRGMFLRYLGLASDAVQPIDILYRSLGLQAVFLAVSGLVLGVAPLLRAGVSGLTGMRGVGWGLLYAAGLGYGYLAVETVLVHELILFVGHPTYAITVVIFTMLLCSGLGSAWVGSRPADRLPSLLRAALIATLLLGALQGFVTPHLLVQTGLGWPVAVRVAVTALAIAPLGVVMGMPFPLALRILRPEAAAMVPWAWAFNGWTSVVASLGTVVVSRAFGYQAAFGVALAAYAVALAVSGRLRHIGSTSTPAGV